MPHYDSYYEIKEQRYEDLLQGDRTVDVSQAVNPERRYRIGIHGVERE